MSEAPSPVSATPPLLKVGSENSVSGHGSTLVFHSPQTGRLHRAHHRAPVSRAFEQFAVEACDEYANRRIKEHLDGGGTVKKPEPEKKPNMLARMFGVKAPVKAPQSAPVREVHNFLDARKAAGVPENLSVTAVGLTEKGLAVGYSDGAVLLLPNDSVAAKKFSALTGILASKNVLTAKHVTDVNTQVWGPPVLSTPTQTPAAPNAPENPAAFAGVPPPETVSGAPEADDAPLVDPDEPQAATPPPPSRVPEPENPEVHPADAEPEAGFGGSAADHHAAVGDDFGSRSDLVEITHTEIPPVEISPEDYNAAMESPPVVPGERATAAAPAHPPGGGEEGSSSAPAGEAEGAQDVKHEAAPEVEEAKRPAEQKPRVAKEAPAKKADTAAPSADAKAPTASAAMSQSRTPGHWSDNYVKLRVIARAKEGMPVGMSVFDANAEQSGTTGLKPIAVVTVKPEDYQVMRDLANSKRDPSYKMSVEPTEDGRFEAHIESARVLNKDRIPVPVSWDKLTKDFEHAKHAAKNRQEEATMKSAAVESAVGTSLLPGVPEEKPARPEDVKDMNPNGPPSMPRLRKLNPPQVVKPERSREP